MLRISNLKHSKYSIRNESNWQHRRNSHFSIDFKADFHFSCKCPAELRITIHRLSVFVQKFICGTGLSDISWAKDIYTTSNFASTISSSSNSCFPHISLILVSEYEANHHLLPFFWNNQTRIVGGVNHHLMHSSLARWGLES